MGKGLLGGNASFNYPPTFYDKKAEKEKELGRSLTTGEFEKLYWIGGAVR